MSSRATGISSLMQMYCCFRREPQALCSMLKEMARLDSVAEYSLTGIDTSPKEIVSEPTERAAMLPPVLRPVPYFMLRADSRLCLRLRASRQRSPVSTSRCAALESLKSSGCAVASSSQVNGIETGAPGTPLGEYATFRVLPRTFML